MKKMATVTRKKEEVKPLIEVTEKGGGLHQIGSSRSCTVEYKGSGTLNSSHNRSTQPLPQTVHLHTEPSQMEAPCHFDLLVLGV